MVNIMSIVKKGFKFITTHLLTIVLSFLVLSIFSWAFSSDLGTKIVWALMLLIYFGMIYSEGWNMAAFDCKPYNDIKPSLLRPIKASLFSLIVPVILVIIYMLPINAWRPFGTEQELKAGTEYTIEIAGSPQTYVDNLTVMRLPDEESEQDLTALLNIIKDGDLEQKGSWNLTEGAVITSDEAKKGANSVVFKTSGTISQTFTPEESGTYHISGYYKGTGKMSMSVKSGDVNKTLKVDENITPLNKQIFRVAANLWYMPLSLLYNNGAGDVTPLQLLYLIFVLPLFAIIGYIVGKTGFSVLDKYATYKNKRLAKKKAAAEAELKAIKAQRKQFKK